MKRLSYIEEARCLKVIIHIQFAGKVPCVSYSVTSFNSDFHSLFRVIKENIRICVFNSTSEIFDRFARILSKNIKALEGKP